MRRFLMAAAAAALLTAPGVASADGLLTSGNGLVQIGINDDGSMINNSLIGLGYNFSGQGGRMGFNDALSPGCYCEAWGVAANGIGGQVGRANGNANITVFASGSGPGSFTSNTELGGLAGLTITQTFTIGAESASGALFKNTVTITNSTGADVTDLRYARAMDWDIPPTEFSEYVTHVGTGTTTALLRATDNGFAYADPMSAVTDTGIVPGNVNTDGNLGLADHGSLFVFGFGDLANGASYTFNIFYGAAANETGALGLLGAVSPELYSLGQSSFGGSRRDDFPTFIFAFNGVGGDVVVPPNPIPEPATWALMIGGFGMAGAVMRRRRREAIA
jgi:hypothetical protein